MQTFAPSGRTDNLDCSGLRLTVCHPIDQLPKFKFRLA